MAKKKKLILTESDKTRHIAAMAEHMNEDRSILETYHGMRVARGNDPIDHLLDAADTMYIDISFDDKNFLGLMKKIYGERMPRTPKELAQEVANSRAQSPELKKHLINSLMRGQAPEQEQEQEESGFEAGKLYNLDYENFKGMKQNYKNLTFVHKKGPHYVFTVDPTAKYSKITLRADRIKKASKIG